MPGGLSFENDFVFGPWRTALPDLGVPSSSWKSAWWVKQRIVGETKITEQKKHGQVYQAWFR